MAYSGWLLKIGDYTVPNSIMKAESYSPYVNMQDLDPWTDTNGFVHRNAVKLKALKVEFETKAMLTDKEFEENDLVIALDSSNMRSLLSRFGKHDKIRMLLQRDVDDPWYTGDFDIAYRDITEGCLNLLSQVVRE